MTDVPVSIYIASNSRTNRMRDHKKRWRHVARLIYIKIDVSSAIEDV